MWPRDRLEWIWSFIGWAAGMVILVVWGIIPAAIFAMIGAGALMLWTKHRRSREN